ncbi:MAG TPA: serine/threonine-protein kinase [Pseudonocardia sp.]|jgi:tRNA A-37 threonylcarbamoyl transferase component Bud32|nr:serine/threonine-protein kinase [Pseudonocardia sp.]
MTAERFGPYRLDELVGRGGMGEVYRAYDTTKDRTVALKRLPRHLADDRGFKSQFRRESQIAARLREPHIIPIHDFGEIDGQLFIDMRLVEGVDLASLLEQQGPLAPERAATIALQVASALAAAHAEHLVHRDVKPANVLVIGADRGEDYVYLVDFGIAHDTSATEFGPGGAMVGSSEYMAPEQFVDGQADSRADIYSLGGLFYTALTGRRPFTADGPAAQMYAHLHAEPPAPSAHEPGLPPGLDRVVAVAMAKSPADRYQSAGEFSAALRAALSDGPGALETAHDPAPARSFGTGGIRAFGWSASPALGDMARRVADQAAAVAGSLGIPTIGPRADERPGHPPRPATGPRWQLGRPDTSADVRGRDALGISLFVAETVSEKAVSAVSDMFWTRLKSTMATLRNEPRDDQAQADDTVVLTTVFEEGPNRTVIEVRIPARTAQESQLDLDRILADAYSAANAQAKGDLRGKHVTVTADDSERGSAVVAIADSPPAG